MSRLLRTALLASIFVLAIVALAALGVSALQSAMFTAHGLRF